MERILICAFGSLGNIRPAAALALRLSSIHEVTLITPPDLIPASSGMDIRWLPASSSFNDLASRSSVDRYRSAIFSQFEDLLCLKPAVDRIFAFGLHYAAQAWAERSGAPYHYVALTPQAFPSNSLPPPSGRIPSNGFLLKLKRFRASIEERVIADPPIREGRKALGLDPLESPSEVRTRGLPVLAADELIAPLPPGIEKIKRIPFITFQSDHDPWAMRSGRDERELDRFLGTGPIAYIGSGSMERSIPGFAEAALKLAGELSIQGVKCVIARSGPDETSCDANAILRGYVDHSIVFPRCSLVIHHGGIGTVMASCLAGAPQLVIPYAFDQHYWARRMRELGVGIERRVSSVFASSKTSRLAIKTISDGRLGSRALHLADALGPPTRREAAIACAINAIIACPSYR